MVDELGSGTGHATIVTAPTSPPMPNRIVTHTDRPKRAPREDYAAARTGPVIVAVTSKRDRILSRIRPLGSDCALWVGTLGGSLAQNAGKHRDNGVIKYFG